MCVVMCKASKILTGNSSNPKKCINEPGWEPKSRREKENVCRNGVSKVNFSKFTQNGPSILASVSLVWLENLNIMEFLALWNIGLTQT